MGLKDGAGKGRVVVDGVVVVGGTGRADLRERSSSNNKDWKAVNWEVMVC